MTVLQQFWFLAAALSAFIAGSFANEVHAADDSAKPQKTVAAVVTLYRRDTHADVLVSRLLEGYSLDGQGARPSLRLASLYVDQVGENDLSRPFAKKYGFPIFDSVEGALTLGTGKLAVDGVLLIAEHGNYPLSKSEQMLYPKQRMFEEIARVFDASGRVVPVFCDKHLSDNWVDAKWMYDTARAKKIPFMAGSSLPSYRREPATDVGRERPLKEIVSVGYGPIEAYGFHSLEVLQCLAERRKGGETGVKRVASLVGDAVWKAGADGLYDVKLLEAALGRAVHAFDPKSDWQSKVKEPVLFSIDYVDGLRGSVILVNGLTDRFTAAWRYADDGGIDSTHFAIQPGRPFMHFAYLLRGIEDMMQSGKPTWPVERTLLTTGMLNAAMISKTNHGEITELPRLNVSYNSNWNWQPRLARDQVIVEQMSR